MFVLLILLVRRARAALFTPSYCMILCVDSLSPVSGTLLATLQTLVFTVTAVSINIVINQLV